MGNLNSLLFNECMVLIIIQFMLFYYKMGFKMALHPGTIFGAIWIFSVFSQELLMGLDLAIIRDLESIRELNIFVASTSVFFSFWILFYSDKKWGNGNFKLELNQRKYESLIIYTFVGAVLLCLYAWYSIGVSSFDLSHIRNLNTRDKNNYFGTKADFLTSILNYTQFFYPLISIFSGYFLGVKYLLKRPIKLKNSYLYLPIAIALIYVLTVGGRNPLFVGVKYYLIGLSLAVPNNFNIEEKMWLFKRIGIVALVLTIFSTYVSDSRQDYIGTESLSSKLNNPILSFFAGGMEYSTSHYYGFQLRNVDTFSESKLGFGYFTFNSLFTMPLPLESYHGLKFKLGEEIGYKENPIDYFYLHKKKMEGYYTTNSVYLGLKLDFGFYGTLIFLFLYTFYTNFLFRKIISGKDVTLYTVFWFYLSFDFWASSNFDSSYSSGFLGGLIMVYLFKSIFVISSN